MRGMHINTYLRPAVDRKHVAVCHTPGKRVWTRDDDGDGVHEVHNNTIEGFWTGLRNLLRPFRGVNKWNGKKLWLLTRH